MCLPHPMEETADVPATTRMCGGSLDRTTGRSRARAAAASPAATGAMRGRAPLAVGWGNPALAHYGYSVLPGAPVAGLALCPHEAIRFDAVEDVAGSET